MTDLVVRALATGPQMSGTDTKSDPIHAVRLLVSPNTTRSSVKRIPNEKLSPSAIRWAVNEASTTTQPQPPSGRSVSAAAPTPTTDDDDGSAGGTAE